MRELLRAELIKLRTTRTFVALVSVAVGLSAALTGAVAALTDPTPQSVLADVFQSDASGLFILILAIVGISGEWRHRTITSSLLAAPDRLRFLAAKTIAFAIAGAALSVVISIAVTVVGLAVLEGRGLPTPEAGDMLELFARNAAVAALLGAFGVGLGVLVRNQAVAIVGVLLVAIVIEPVLIGLAPEVGRYGPISALPTAIAGLNPGDTGLGSVDLPSAGAAVGLMLAWIGALLAAGGTLLKTRDIE